MMSSMWLPKSSPISTACAWKCSPSPSAAVLTSDLRPWCLLHGIDGLSNILSLADGAGCQVYTGGCLTGIVSSYFIFSLGFITSPFGCPIFHPVTELASGWVELEISSLLVDNLILVFLSFCVSFPHDSTSDVSVLSVYYIYVGESFLYFWVFMQIW